MLKGLYKETKKTEKPMEVKIKRLSPLSKIPSKAKPGDAGMDLTVTEMEQKDQDHIQYKFGIAIEIPPGYVGLIFPRSSIYKKAQILSNSVGVIDSGYRGEIIAVMLGNDYDRKYQVGDRAAQLIIMPYPEIKFKVTDDLSITDRGTTGYGSSDIINPSNV